MDWQAYAALYPDGPGQDGFERLQWEARRIMDRACTGVDGVRKLTEAPPAAGQDAQAVERCEAALTHLLWQTEQSEGLTARADGSMTTRMVTAVTAGSESVTYAAPAAAGTAERETLIRQTLERYLAGVPDGNGVSLLYMGRYPR